MPTEKKTKRRYRRRQLCIHHCGYDQCGIWAGGVHWLVDCIGPCENYKERKAGKSKKKAGEP